MGKMVISRYIPPYDLTADMVFTLGFIPSGNVKDTFPGVKFLSVLGKMPVIITFAHYKKVCFTTEKNDRSCIEKKTVYNEIFFATFLQRFAVFVPTLLATSDLSIEIAKYYDMPKRKFSMDFTQTNTKIDATASDANKKSSLSVLRLPFTSIIAKVVSLFLPLKSWQVFFPSSKSTRGYLQSISSAELGIVKQSDVQVNEKWLGKIMIVPLCLFVSDFVFKLPPPKE